MILTDREIAIALDTGQLIIDPRPAQVAGADFFGLLGTFELYAKASGNSWINILPSEAWAGLPYLATVVALAIISISKSAGGNAPASLGKPFIPST